MSNHPKILDVVDNDMCIACGACIPACPFDAVVPNYSDYRGAHEVTLTTQQHCADCDAPCDSVCPSLIVNYAELQGCTNLPREGNIIRTCLAYVKKHRDNGVSSSGGIVRACIEMFLTMGKPVVCLARADAGGYEPALLTRLDDMRRLPGSIYQGVSFAKAIPLLQQANEACLLVSTPCQLEGIEKYLRVVDPMLNQKIALRLGLICGWMYTDHALKAFASYKGIGQEIHDAQYRGEDQVGLLKIKTEQGDYSYHRRVFDTPNDELDYRASFTSSMNRARCRSCQNHVNVLADIAVGDAWLKRSPGVKRSIVVIRSDQGSQAFNELCATFDVVSEAADDGDLVESQSANLVEGIEARQLATYLSESGSFAPKFSYAADRQEQNSNVTPAKRKRFQQEWELRALIRSGNYAKHRAIYGKRRRQQRVKSQLRAKLSAAMKYLGLWDLLRKK